MADNVTLNSMSGGSVVATDDAGAGGQVQIVKLAYSADGDRTHIPATAAGLAVVERGSIIISLSASVTTTSGQIISSSATRRSVVFTNLGTDYVWIGGSGVTDNQGIRLAPGQALTIDKSTAAVHGKAASSTQTVAIFAEFD